MYWKSHNESYGDMLWLPDNKFHAIKRSLRHTLNNTLFYRPDTAVFRRCDLVARTDIIRKQIRKKNIAFDRYCWFGVSKNMYN